VARLRAVDLPLPEVRTCVLDPDAVPAVPAVLERHRARRQARADRVSGRLHAFAGDLDAARDAVRVALDVPVVEDEDRALLLADLGTLPDRVRPNG
jgi:hypothetical protein